MTLLTARQRQVLTLAAYHAFSAVTEKGTGGRGRIGDSAMKAVPCWLGCGGWHHTPRSSP